MELALIQASTALSVPASKHSHLRPDKGYPDIGTCPDIGCLQYRTRYRVQYRNISIEGHHIQMLGFGKVPDESKTIRILLLSVLKNTEKYAQKYAKKYAEYAKNTQFSCPIRISARIRKLRKKYAKYAKYAKSGNIKKIRRIRTPHFADGLAWFVHRVPSFRTLVKLKFESIRVGPRVWAIPVVAAAHW